MPRTIYTDAQDLQIIRLLAEGKTVKEASALMNMNVRAVEARIVRLREKDGASTITHLVAKFLMRGQITPAV